MSSQSSPSLEPATTPELPTATKPSPLWPTSQSRFAPATPPPPLGRVTGTVVAVSPAGDEVAPPLSLSLLHPTVATTRATTSEPAMARIDFTTESIARPFGDRDAVASAFHYVLGGSMFNTLGAGVTLMDDGRLLFGTMFGKARVLRS